MLLAIHVMYMHLKLKFLSYRQCDDTEWIQIHKPDWHMALHKLLEKANVQ